MNTLALALQREHSQEARRAGAIAAQQLHLLSVEKHLALLVQRLFPDSGRQQLDIDMAVIQSLRQAVSGMAMDSTDAAALLATLKASLGESKGVADAIVMKYLYGVPLRSQCQRLKEGGSEPSLAGLCRQVGAASALLAVAHQAQLERVMQSRQLRVDGAPVPCRVKRQGRVAECWYWPLHSGEDEISFLFSPSPSRTFLEVFLESHYQGEVSIGDRAAFTAYRAGLASRLSAKQAGAMARKLWRFSGSETSNEHVGIFKSLIANCAMQGLKPAGYLAGAMTLIATSASPAMLEITPRDWRDALGGIAPFSEAWRRGERLLSGPHMPDHEVVPSR
ncbi:IS66 family transposase [Halomonas mongoliensis]|uniref:IS66 family transposase n=1 Tax=Halomonas mongoliensis TaxID=321265 RepID=UPI00403AD93C